MSSNAKDFLPWDLTEKGGIPEILYKLASQYTQAFPDAPKNGEVHKLAYYFYYQAATLGLAKAQFETGRCLEHGDGVEKNLEEALKWYQRAAAQGYPDLQNNIRALQEQLASLSSNTNVGPNKVAPDTGDSKINKEDEARKELDKKIRAEIERNLAIIANIHYYTDRVRAHIIQDTPTDSSKNDAGDRKNLNESSEILHSVIQERELLASIAGNLHVLDASLSSSDTAALGNNAPENHANTEWIPRFRALQEQPSPENLGPSQSPSQATPNAPAQTANRASESSSPPEQSPSLRRPNSPSGRS